MAELLWFQAVEMLQPHIVRITTPRVAGTGFLISHSASAPFCAIATAAHVVNHAFLWEEPIRIEHKRKHWGRVFILDNLVSRPSRRMAGRGANISF